MPSTASTDDSRLVKSVDGGFEIRMPPGNVNWNTIADDRGIGVHMLLVENREILYIVMYTDISGLDGAPEEAQYRGLESSCELALAKYSATLIHQKPIRLAGRYPGMHLRARPPETAAGVRQLLRVSCYLVGKRLYNLTAIGSSKLCDDADTDEFFHTFALLGSDPFAKDPKRYVSPDGKFQVCFPFAPRIEDVEGGHRYVAASVQGRYVVEATKLPGADGKEFAERSEILNGAVAKALRDNDGKVSELAETRLVNRYDGRALRADIRLRKDAPDRGLYRGRFYVVAGTLYAVHVTGKAADAEGAYPDYFLRSFAAKP